MEITANPESKVFSITQSPTAGKSSRLLAEKRKFPVTSASNSPSADQYKHISLYVLLQPSGTKLAVTILILRFFRQVIKTMIF
jgi:hypothetical protein